MNSIFLDFPPPNSTTWSLFSITLTVAFFFQFARPAALRNWDLVALHLFVPGFLLLQEAHRELAPFLRVDPPSRTEVPPRSVRHDRLVPAESEELESARRIASTKLFAGYAWLMGASVFWFGRCLFDLAAVKRPLLVPNLSTGGLIWFGAALFVIFAATLVQSDADPWSSAYRHDVLPFRWSERTAAACCRAATVMLLVFIGQQLFGDLRTGVAAAALQLLIPYSAFRAVDPHAVWPAVPLLAAIACYKRPGIAGVFFGLATGTAYFPLLALPLWLQFYRGRGTFRFLIPMFLVTVATIAAYYALAYPQSSGRGFFDRLDLVDWQPWRVPTTESLWTGVHWAYRIPLFILCAGLSITSLLWPPIKNLGQLIAATAAAAIATQFWYADRGGLHVLHYAPLLVLMILRPNVTDLVPGPSPAWPEFVKKIFPRLWRRTIPSVEPSVPAPRAEPPTENEWSRT